VRLLLDTAVVGEICHPRKYDDVRAWFARAAAAHENVTVRGRHSTRRSPARELERDAVASGIAVLRLDVTATNPFLVRYYTERGFDAVGHGEIMGCPSIFLQKLLA
jgi:hypothetical protein